MAKRMIAAGKVKGTKGLEQPLKCGACARIGTNDTRPMAHSPSCEKERAVQKPICEQAPLE